VTDGIGKITERNLTVYNGVNWGFDLSVAPEPGTFLLVFPALGLLAVLRRKAVTR
jgi:PEP-CTERM motif